MSKYPAWFRVLSCMTVWPWVLITSDAHAQQQPPLPDLTGIVKDEGWARILGKALFWDTVANAKGADCGGCHFVTGANNRIPDQSAAPLELRRVAVDDPANAPTAAAVSANDRSSGIVDVCSRRISTRPQELPDFGPVLAASRQSRDPEEACGEDVVVRLAHSLLEHKPLEARSINPDDATFGPSGPHGNLVSPTGRGLERTYQWMIQEAFEDTLWKPADGAATASENLLSPAPGPYPKVEENFQLFWGIAVMVYESTLDPGWIADHEIARRSAVPASTGAQAERE